MCSFNNINIRYWLLGIILISQYMLLGQYNLSVGGAIFIFNVSIIITSTFSVAPNQWCKINLVEEISRGFRSSLNTVFIVLILRAFSYNIRCTMSIEPSNVRRRNASFFHSHCHGLDCSLNFCFWLCHMVHVVRKSITC